MGKISVDQKQIVADYEEVIADSQQSLIRIRHDMAKVRTMTFKKIYDLHKQVQIAEALELGINRRLSVASATELEKEQRHHRIKIQRQLATLNNQSILNGENGCEEIAKYEKNLGEIVDIQKVMSHKKLKAFFSVFIQIFNQTLCDIELMHQNINCQRIENGVTTKDHLDKITLLCQSLYGISNRMNMVIVYIARKLCVNEHMIDEIERTHDQQIPRLAQIRAKDIFEAIISDQQIFEKRKKPKNIKEAAHNVLENVFGIF